MKSLLVLLSVVGLIACDKVELKTESQKTSYIVGQQIGRQLKSQNMELDANIVAASIKDVIAGKESRMSMKDMQETMMAVQTKMMAQQQTKQAQLAEIGKDAKAKGEKFLKENKTKTGVKTTASGLQYEVITAGSGPKPSATDIVKVHYKGTFIDGTEFDSSYKRGEPAKFPVNGVIKGWTEALQLMPVGSKYKLSIPSKLAYGPKGNPAVPPDSVLNFDVELLEIVK